MIDRETAMRHAQDWVAAFNRRDLETVIAFYAEEVEVISPALARLPGLESGLVRGKAALRSAFARGLEMRPKLHFELVDVLLGMNVVTVLYRNEFGILVTDSSEFDASGNIRRMVACYGMKP